MQIGTLSRHDAAIKNIVENDEDHVWYHPRWNRPPDGFTLSGFVRFLTDGDGRYQIRCQPDAWNVSFCTGTVYWLEVVDTHKIDQRKLDDIEALFWILDQIEFGLVLVVHDVEMGTTITVTHEQMELWADCGCRAEPWKIQPEVTAV